MFSEDKKTQYKADIKLGERYLDEQTGIEGVATVIAFFQYACERVTLEMVVGGKIEEFSFDAGRLTHIDSGKKAETNRNGGPDRGGAQRPRVPSRR